MNFSASKKATIDNKGRVVLPADYKNEMGGRIPGGQLAIEQDPYENCLNIYPIDEWEKRLTHLKSKLNRNNPKQSRLLDMIYQRFKVISVPESCRMNIPNDFLEKMNIKKEVIFVGVDNRIRLWGTEEYDAYMGTMEDFGSLFKELYGGEEEL